MLQDRGRYEPPRRNYEASRAPVERGVTSREPQLRYDKFREEKAIGKQNMNEVKEAPKPTNPYARPAPIKCSKCNQTGYRSSDYPLRKAVHLAERKEEVMMKFVVSPMGMVMKMRPMRRKMMRGVIMWSGHSC